MEVNSMSTPILLLLAFIPKSSQNITDIDCPQHCRTCYLGRCFSCKDGWFGRGCSYSCSLQCKYGECSENDCRFGCVDGFYGKHCTHTCLGCVGRCSRTFGVCSFTYETENSRDEDTKEEEEEENPDKVNWANVLKIGGVILIAACVVCVIGYRYHNHIKDRDDSGGDDPGVRSMPETFAPHPGSYTPRNRSPYSSYHNVNDSAPDPGFMDESPRVANPSPTVPPLPPSTAPLLEDQSRATVVPPPSYQSLFPDT